MFLVFCARNSWNKCQHNFHHLSSRSKEDTRYQTSISCHDCQEHEEIFHIRGSGVGWQECSKEVSSQQLSVHHQGEAVHLHNAHEVGWGMEPDSVQPGRFYPTCLWNKLCGDIASADSCKLSNKTGLLLRSSVQRGGVASRI